MAAERSPSAEPNPPPVRWHNKRQVAHYYGFSVRWVEARMAEGLPSVLIGGQRRFRLAETDRYLLGDASGETSGAA